MSCVVLYTCESLWYVLDFCYIRICVLDDLQSHSIGRAMVFAGDGVIVGLLVEAFTSFSNGIVFVSKVGSGLHRGEQLHIWLCH